MKILFFSFFFLSNVLYSQTREHIVVEGCGTSEYAAKQKAKEKAVKVAAAEEEECLQQGGLFSVKYSDGYCSPYDPTNLTCPASCNVVVQVNCLP